MAPVANRLTISRGRLDFLEGQRIVGKPEFEQAPQVLEFGGLVVDGGRVLLELLEVGFPDGVLQGGDRVRCPDMLLAPQAEGQLAAGVEGIAEVVRSAVRLPMPADRLLGHLFEADPFDDGVGAGEVLLDELPGQSDGVEDLSTAIGLEGRDAHLGHDLLHALLDGIDVPLLRLPALRLGRVIEQGDGIEGEVRVDGFGAVAAQQAEIVDLPGLAGLDHQADLRPESFANEVMVHGGGGQQRRYGDPGAVDATVGEDQDVVARLDAFGSPPAQPIERRLHAGGSFFDRVTEAEPLGAKGMVDVVLDPAQLFQRNVGQDGVLDLETLVGSARIEVEEVGPGPDQGNQRHDQFLPDGVDGRVGDLREVLLEIVVEHLGAVREHCRGDISAHRSDRILAGGGHRLDEELDVFPGVPKRLLGVEERLGIRRHGSHFVGQLTKPDLCLVEPLLVRMGGCQIRFELLVADDATLLEVDQQHLARLQAPLLDDALFGNVQDSDLGGHDDQILVGDQVAGRAQPVAIEGGADLAAVGEGHGRRSVPRFHEGRVILVESPPFGVHQRVVFPGFRDHEHHGVTERVPAGHQQLQGIVECGRV